MTKIAKRFLLPNTVTALNMMLGFISVIMTLNNEFIKAAWLIIIAMFMDGMDGKIARIVNGFSEFGKEFDSFCDAISFGMAPAVLIYSIMMNIGFRIAVIFPISFLFLLCGVMRLVKFNIITTASKTKADFIGLPIPAAAGTMASYIIFMNSVFGSFKYPHLFLLLGVIVSFLMVSTVPYKPIIRAFKVNPERKMLLKVLFLFSIAMTIFAKYTFFPFGISYILVGVFDYFLQKDMEDEESDEMIENEINK